MDSKAGQPRSVQHSSFGAAVVFAETDLAVRHACGHHKVSMSPNGHSDRQSVTAWPLRACRYADHQHGSLITSGAEHSCLTSLLRLLFFALGSKDPEG